MKKAMILLALLMPLTSCSSNGEVEYVPVVLVWDSGEQHFETREDLKDDSDFLDCVEKVLDEYSEEYSRSGNVVYISSRLARDTDLLANYTAKAIAIYDEREP